jgi:hypothetical protein
MTVLLSAFSIFLAVSISTTVVFISSAVLIAVPVLGPAILVWAQRYKKYVEVYLWMDNFLTTLAARSEVLGMSLFPK